MISALNATQTQGECSLMPDYQSFCPPCVSLTTHAQPARFAAVSWQFWGRGGTILPGATRQQLAAKQNRNGIL